MVSAVDVRAGRGFGNGALHACLHDVEEGECQWRWRKKAPKHTGWLKYQCIDYSSGRQKSIMKVWVGLVPYSTVKKTVLLCCSLASESSLAIFVTLCLVDVTL